MLKMVIIGATSKIAQETAKYFAADGAQFLLVARSQDKLDIIAQDLMARGAKSADSFIMDMNDFDRHQELLDHAVETLDGIDALFIAHGTLGDQAKAEADVEYMLEEFKTNFLSTAAFLTLTANYFEAQQRGSITVISSVAGDRGRGSLYVYGTAMAAKTTFLQGLRNRLAKSNVHVLTVKPGRVDTPMTADLKKSPLLANPAKVGEHIYKAMKNKRDIIYTPPYWAVIMMIIRNIPERIFKRLSM